MKYVTVAEMQAIERQADAAGLSYAQMMANAGQGLAEKVTAFYGPLKDYGALGLVGSGNNGGDTLVALKHLAEHGWKASAYLARPRPADDPLLAELHQAGGRLYQASEDPDFTQLKALLAEHAVLLDGVLGTGVRLPLKPEVASVLAAVKAALAALKNPPPVVAVDCPSGVDCDSGEAASETLPADRTVTMAAIKAGLLKLPAYALTGQIELVGIGLPDGAKELPAWQAVRTFVPDAAWVRSVLPARPLSAHKGTFGTALAVVGSLNYTGAALLAGEAAYRIGAGLVTLAVPAPLHAALAGRLPEATWVLLPHDLGVIAEDAVETVRASLGRATALLVGPGLGTESTTAEFVRRLLAGERGAARAPIGFAHPQEKAPAGEPPLPPLVVDADGLKLLASLPNWWQRLPAPAVLTPHPGEMAILTGLETKDIQAERLETARRYSQAWGHVVVLKGAFTVVAAPDGPEAVIPVATPALARAGTGDVLAGLVLGLRAQGVEAFPAAVAAAWIHAQAGLRAAERMGNAASVLAGDLLPAVVEVLNTLNHRQNFGGQR